MVAATCALGLTAAACSLVALLVNRVARTPTLRVDGRPAPAEATARRAWLDELARRRAGARILLGADGAWTTARLGELGVLVDVSATEAELRRASKRSLWERLRGGRMQVDVPLRFGGNGAVARTRLDDLARRLRREPIGARLDLSRHARVHEVVGRELDVEETLARVADAASNGQVRADAVTRPLLPTITEAALAEVDVTKVVASFETTFANTGVGVGRSANIRNAAAKMDGTMLKPGDSFSFNDVVGPRTLEAGFAYAPEIVGDELETGVGGGTCQVASTLHAAALFGAMDVVERHAHGRASSYAKVGLDATVAYGRVDLRLRNPFSFPVILHAYLPTPTAVRVEIIGGEPQATVKYGWAVHKSEDFFRRITFKPSLEPGTVVKHQKGARGQAIISFVTVTFPDGRSQKRVYSSDYRPVPEVLWVGPGVDEATLPEVPEGATRVERRGLPDVPAAGSPAS